MTVTDELLRRADTYAARFDKGDLAMLPSKRVAIVACMDARVNPYGIFGLTEGEAHVMRNAGAAITDDVIRSLAISQRLLGTTEVILLRHADCGMKTFKNEEFQSRIYEETGIRPTWTPETSEDSGTDLCQSVARLRSSPFLPHRGCVRGFVYDEKTGRLTEATC